MSKPTDIRIVDLKCDFETTPFRGPLKFGGRVVSASEVLNVTAVVETRLGARGTGFGSMPLGNVWGWPSPRIEPDQSAEAVRRVGRSIVTHAGSRLNRYGHPIDLMCELEPAWRRIADNVTADMGLRESMPQLMILVAGSPLDAALHDAFGKVHGLNVYNAYGPEFVEQDLSHHLTPEFQGEYLDRYTLRQPKPTMPLYHLVGALDPLTPADVTKPIGDGLPEHLGEWIAYDGLTHMKIKLAGDNLAWDVERVAAVDRAAVEAQAKLGRTQWWYSLDFNEKCRNVEYVLEFLEQIRVKAPGAFERTQYIEQPTARDLRAHPENKMHRAAAIKPVVIDESLVDLASLQLSVQQGYSGVALKACKGQTQALLMGAYAQKHGMFLCVQDLTCPGASFLQSAGIAARLPTIAAIEGNSRQFCPAGNRDWAQRFPTVFKPNNGTIETGRLTGPGLGY